MIKLYRPKRFLNIGVPAVTIRLAFGIYFLSKYWSDGSYSWLAVGVLFPLSIIIQTFSSPKPRITFEETLDGFVSKVGWTESKVRWDQIVALARGMKENGKYLIVWRETVDSKDKFVLVSARDVGDDGLRTVRDLIESKRPNLPDFSGGKVQDHGPAASSQNDPLQNFGFLNCGH